jgi:GDP-L-fucose synthase
MNKDAKILVLGGNGMVGKAMVRQLHHAGYLNVAHPGREQLNLFDLRAVDEYFDTTRPQYVFLAAAKVGGICANSASPADFIVANLTIQTNVISKAANYGVRRLLFFGSACAYPKFAPVPITEDQLLLGELEGTNRAYAIAKIAGIEMCDAYRYQCGVEFFSCMPTNLYGPGDHYDLELSHVLPGMMRRFHEAHTSGAESVTLWGTGTPTREFLYVDDLARAAIRLMNLCTPPRLVNITSGEEIPLNNLAYAIAWVVGFRGEVKWDRSRPDGTPRRALDGTGMTFFDWKPETDLQTGLRHTYEDFLWHLNNEKH